MILICQIIIFCTSLYISVMYLPKYCKQKTHELRMQFLKENKICIVVLGMNVIYLLFVIVDLLFIHNLKY